MAPFELDLVSVSSAVLAAICMGVVVAVRDESGWGAKALAPVARARRQAAVESFMGVDILIYYKVGSNLSIDGFQL